MSDPNSPETQLQMKLASIGTMIGTTPQVEPDSLAQLVRVSSTLQAVLENIDSDELDEASRNRAAVVFDAGLSLVQSSLDEAMASELGRMVTPLDVAPSTSTVRLAYCQFAAWLSSVVSAEMTRGAANALQMQMSMAGGGVIEIEASAPSRNRMGYL